MQIAICDDRKQDCKLLTKYIVESLEQRRIAYDLTSFECGEALLTTVGEMSFDIYFLDIFMSGISGVETARRIRENQPGAAIVFTTTSREHALESYEVAAAHYIVKPVSADAVDDALERSLRQIGEAKRYVELTIDRKGQRLLLDSIIYAESFNQNCLLHLESGELRIYSSLEALERLLDDPRFLRCHRSFLVNLDRVSQIEGNDIHMSDGGLIPIRREDRSRVRQIYGNYLFDKARRGM